MKGKYCVDCIVFTTLAFQSSLGFCNTAIVRSFIISFNCSTSPNPNIISNVDDPERQMTRTGARLICLILWERIREESQGKRLRLWRHACTLWRTVTAKIPAVWITTLKTRENRSSIGNELKKPNTRLNTLLHGLRYKIWLQLNGRSLHPP